MVVLVFFGIVILFSLMLTVADKIKAFKNENGCHFWWDGDSVMVKSKEDTVVSGEVGKHLGTEYTKSVCSKVS